MNLIIVIILIIELFLLISYITYRKIFYSPDKEQNDIYNIPKEEQYNEKKDYMITLIKELDEREYEDVFIRSYDGLVLHGKYYFVKKDAPLDIGFHGYRATSIRDFCGGAAISKELEHNLLLVDQRAHGLSEGNTITFGIKEKYDVLSWILYAENNLKAKKINLYGVSMGASSILMASTVKLPKSVNAIIADSPFSSVKGIIKKVVKDRKLNYKLLAPFIFTGAYLFGKINLNEGEIIPNIKNVKKDILIIHGEDDRFVPHTMSEEIAKCNKKIKRVTFKDAGHGLSFIKDEKKYKKVVKELLK